MKPKVIFKNVAKTYTLYEGKFDKLVDLVASKKKKNKTFYALSDISFEVYEGETIGIIGVNGSGKSTLSNLLAQVMPATSGEITINGETSLIAISAGLNINLTGLDNIELKCLMHGLSKESIEEITPKIMEFADIGDFIRQPVKNYSSGMKSRLGFAISVHTDPDILIIDEALSVGDETFYEKCLTKMEEFKKQGKTIFFISHSISQVRSFCDKAMWLHHGKVQSYGGIGKVIREYKEYISWYRGLNADEQKKYKREMMAKQFIPSDKSDSIEGASLELQGESEKKKKKDSSGLGKNAILTVLFLCLLVSAYMMVQDGVDPAATIAAKVEKPVKVKKTSQPVQKEGRPIHQEGFINENNSALFKEVEQKNPLLSLDFSKKVMVLEEVGQLFKVQLDDGTIGYTDQKNITLANHVDDTKSVKMSGILPITPTVFSHSYQFYLAYINAKEENIKHDLRGLSNEMGQNPNEKLLEYKDRNVLYRIHNGESTAIIVTGIDTSSPEFHSLSGNAILKDQEGNMGLVVTEKNRIIYNKSDESLTIETK
ncbi:teichoic acids export ATP-binding protein TagH [Neobacillus bataviensis LMG 21833]|uniref:Teichoic acids export ATP-binding protein TagH n=1 Tax=Neobacillus bataviensis LMG 21833 TaxID=1117379 RepID=K6DEH4_9BACI|nr:teichoic acids export ABC transporter ATP-binding subunit TagH [Neobacillus bataviensis]EKN66468.1 teichoic acids export ATP-binding protein TagH [Neobacillus bataviensis LMG 21833]